MKIKKINLEDWKGVSGTTDLQTLNLLVGPNGSGKTARLLAPTFAITGKTPLGATADKTMALAGHLGCKVGLELDDGFTFARGLVRDVRKHTLSQELHVVGQEELKITEANPIVQRHTGCLAEMFDLSEFTSKSPEAKRSFVLDLCARACREGDGAIRADEILDRITLEFLRGCNRLGPGTVGMYAEAKHGVSQVERLSDEQRRETIDGLLPKLTDRERKILAEALKELVGELRGDMTTAIGAAIDRAKAMANASRDERNKSQQATRKLTEEKNTITVGAAGVQELEAQLADLRERREEIIQQIASQEGRESGLRSLRESIASVDGQLTETKEAIDLLIQERLAPLSDAEALEADAKRLREEESTDANPPRELEDRRDALLNAETGLANSIQRREHELSARRERLAMIESQIARLEDDPWLRADELADRASNLLPDDSSDELLHAIGALREYLHAQVGTGKLEALRTELPTVKDAIAAMMVEIEAFKADHKTAIDARLAVEKELRSARDSYNEKLATSRETLDMAHAKERMAAEIRQAHTNHDRELAAIHKRHAEIENDLLARAKELHDLQAAGGDIPMEQLIAQRDGLDHQIQQAKDALTSRQKYQVLETQLTACIASAEEEAIRHELCKDLVEAIQAIRETLMAVLIAPLRDRIDRFLSVASPGRRCYCDLVNDRNREIFDLGWIVDDIRKVSLDAMSGGEAALFGAALLYAIVSASDVPLKLLLIEAGDLDTDNMLNLIDALEDVSGELSNVVVATHTLDGITLDGWNIIHTAAAETRELEAVTK